MLVPAHLVTGPLLGRLLDVPTGWVVVGVAHPDLVDKSLAMLGVTGLNHSVGHSLAALVELSALGAFGRRGAAVWSAGPPTSPWTPSR